MAIPKNIVSKTGLAILAIVLAAYTSVAQSTAAAADEKEQKGAAIKNLLDTKRYIFKAQTAFPTSGAARQLTQDFDLRVLGDTLQSFLPYFGRSYSAPLNPDEAGLRFTSVQYEYSVKTTKKGWDVLMVPKDTRDVRRLLLRVSTGGYASLQVTSNNKQAISFNGYVAERNRN